MELERQLREAERQLLSRDRIIADLKMRLPASQDKEKISKRIADLSGGAHSGTIRVQYRILNLYEYFSYKCLIPKVPSLLVVIYLIRNKLYSKQFKSSTYSLIVYCVIEVVY